MVRGVWQAAGMTFLCLVTPAVFAADVTTMTNDCEGGALESCNALGYSYAEGIGVQRSPERAAATWAAACDRGFLESCMNVAGAYLMGSGVPKSTAKALKAAVPVCESKAVRSEVRYAACYYAGLAFTETGTDERTLMSAKSAFAVACDGGIAAACFNVGGIYAGWRDAALATKYYEKACALGDADGCRNLGIFLYNSIAANGAVSVNASTAPTLGRVREAFGRACDLGKTDSCARAGDAYMKGEGGEEDWPRALALHKLGCAAGDDRSCRGEADLLSMGGNGVNTDFARASVIYKRLCEVKNIAGACWQMQLIYERPVDGQSPAPDASTAAKYAQRYAELR